MPFIMIKNIKGNDYAYLYECVWDGSKPHNRYLAYLGRADALSREQMENVKVERQKSKDARLNKRLIITKDGLKIYKVNGQYVRDNLEIGFTMGSHGYVSKFIPKWEIWLDDRLNDKDVEALIAHEIDEVKSMRKGMSYTRAHKKAHKVESKVRKGKAELGSMKSGKGELSETGLKIVETGLKIMAKFGKYIPSMEFDNRKEANDWIKEWGNPKEELYKIEKIGNKYILFVKLKKKKEMIDKN